MNAFDTTRGRIWAVLIGLMGGMIIGLPFRPGVVHRFSCHHHGYGAGCPWLRNHPDAVYGGAGPGMPVPPCEHGEEAPGHTVTLPPARTVREIHVAPGVGVRLELDAATGARPTRDPFTAPARSN